MLSVSYLWSHLRDWDELNFSGLHRLHSLPEAPRQMPVGGRKWTGQEVGYCPVDVKMRTVGRVGGHTIEM